MDLLSLFIGSAIGVLVRFGHDEMSEYVFHHVEGWLLLFGGILLANYLSGSYRLQYMFSRFNLIVTWIFSLIFTLLVLSITSYAWFTVVLGRGVLFLSIASYSAISLFLKLLVYRSLFRSEVFMCRTAIVGIGDRAREIRRTTENRLVLPAHKVVAFIRIFDDDDNRPQRITIVDGVAVVDSHVSEMEDILRSLNVKLVIVGMDDLEKGSKLYPKLSRMRFEGIELLTPLSVAEIYTGRTPLELINDEIMMRVSMDCNLPLLARSKRVFDIAAALIACIVFFPIALIVTVLIKLSAPRSPVVYSQTRVGRLGKDFKIHKFRTMRENAEADTGAVWAELDDPRITRVGRFLRRTRFDEIPQFFNILKGDMSVVGPRPERPEITAKLVEEIPYYTERENVMPGLTGWAQIRYTYGSSLEDTKRKLEYDLYYVKHLSMSLDLQIILSTLRIVLFGKERAP
jgi:exopolysaccharide biosynthesis polyprenyl glycosylphosphotransferase